jgi:hypothetical protein
MRRIALPLPFLRAACAGEDPSPPDPTGRLHGAAPLALLAVACAVLAACDRAAGTDGNDVDALPRLTAEADARIGDFEDPNVGFSRVGGVDVDRDGNVYVLEASVPEIRVYTPDGTLVRRIGKRGGGPGEFESPPRFGVFGDTVWSVDTRADRITLFDRSGAVLSTGKVDPVPVRLPASYGHVLPLSMRPDGKFTSQLSRVAYNPNGEATGVKPTDRIPVPFVLFAATGEVTDTIGWAPRPPPRMWRPPSEDDSRFPSIQVDGRRMSVPEPPTRLPWWVGLPDGYLLVETPLADAPEDGTFTVTRFGLSGDTVYRRTLHYRPVPYSAADLDSIAARAARGEAGGMVPFVLGPGKPPVPDNWEAIAHTLRGAMDFPRFQLPIRSVWLAQDGSLWLRREDVNGATARWIVLDDEGRPRGALDLPADVRIVWSRGDTLWAVSPDENDVPWLVRYRIRPG